MNALKIIGTILILISLGVGYFGFKKVADNTKEVNILGLEIETSNKSGKQQGYIYLGLGALLFAGGIYTITKK